MLQSRVFVCVDQEDDVDNAAAASGEDGEADDDSDESSSADYLSDIDDGKDDDDDDDDSAAVTDNDVDGSEEKGDLSSENCEPPAKKRVHFADSVEIEKPPTMMVSGLYCIRVIITVKSVW